MLRLLVVATVSLGAARVALLPVFWVSAQVAPDAGGIDIISLLTQGMISAVFLWLYLRAEGERKEAQKSMRQMQQRHEDQMAVMRQQQLDLMERMSPMFAQAIDTLDAVQKGMEHTVEHVSMPSRQRYLELELQRATRVIDQLQETLGEMRKDDE